MPQAQQTGQSGKSRRIKCPFCDSSATELISLFGSQLLLSQYRCRQCGSYFEGVRGDDADGD